MLRILSLPILLASVALAQQDAPPTGAEQDRLLDSMAQYAAAYIGGLPNFLCLQVTRQFEAGLKGKKWHKGDVLSFRLSFHDRDEKRTLELVNGKPADPMRRSWHTPLVSEGEFGLLLGQVMQPSSDAAFTWSRWETVRGRRLAVFDYEVDQQHSTLSLQLSDLAKAVLPFRGSVWADPETGKIWRISDTADTGIPRELHTQAISTVIDYDETTIGDRSYLLPATATVAVTTDTRRVRNELEFQAYRKFGAESVIRFGDQ